MKILRNKWEQTYNLEYFKRKESRGKNVDKQNEKYGQHIKPIQDLERINAAKSKNLAKFK